MVCASVYVCVCLMLVYKSEQVKLVCRLPQRQMLCIGWGSGSPMERETSQEIGCWTIFSYLHVTGLLIYYDFRSRQLSFFVLTSLCRDERRVIGHRPPYGLRGGNAP